MKTSTQSAPSWDELGKLLLRIVLSVLLLMHGISKATGGIAFLIGMFNEMGIPAAFSYLVFVGEVLAPVLILLGIWTRLGAAVVAINMLVAILLVHTGDVFTLSSTGGWALELQGFYLAAAGVLLLQGAGRFSLSGPNGRWN